MPQVFMILSPGEDGNAKCGAAIANNYVLPLLEKTLISLTEQIFGIEDKNDVALTVIIAKRTKNEADIQVEVRYTAGEDEYGKGKPFNPSKEKQEELASAIIKEIKEHVTGLTVSAWIVPFYHSVFKSE